MATLSIMESKGFVMALAARKGVAKRANGAQLAQNRIKREKSHITVEFLDSFLYKMPNTESPSGMTRLPS